MCRRGVYFGHVDSVSTFLLWKKRRLGPNAKNNTISLNKSVLTVEAIEAIEAIEATCFPTRPSGVARMVPGQEEELGPKTTHNTRPLSDETYLGQSGRDQLNLLHAKCFSSL